jgi:hypothetical protein
MVAKRALALTAVPSHSHFSEAYKSTQDLLHVRGLITSLLELFSLRLSPSRRGACFSTPSSAQSSIYSWPTGRAR